MAKKARSGQPIQTQAQIWKKTMMESLSELIIKASIINGKDYLSRNQTSKLFIDDAWSTK